MFTRLSFAASALALTLSALGSTAVGSGHADAAGTRARDCAVTLRAHNTGARAVVVRLGMSRWKQRGGLWNRMANESDWLVAADGKEKSRTVRLSLPCDTGARQYEFDVSMSDATRVLRHPGNDDYAGGTTIALGNVARVF